MPCSPSYSQNPQIRRIPVRSNAVTAHQTEIIAPADEPIIIVKRRFDASPDLVFRAWTDAELLRQWWLGPEGMVMTRCEIDGRPGGTWRMEQQDMQGNAYAFYGEYLEFDPPARLVQTFRMEMDGLRDPAIVETLTFEADGGGTLVTAHSVCPNFEARTAMVAGGMEEGMNASFARLVGVLEQERSEAAFTIERVFDAPVERVWQCFTKKEHIDMWMVPGGFSVVAQDADLTIGGKWRSHIRHPDLGDWKMGGVYREIEPKQRLVFTHKWTASPQGASAETLVTIDFQARGNKTHMVFSQSGFIGDTARTGNRGGWVETFGNLESHLARLQ